MKKNAELLNERKRKNDIDRWINKRTAGAVPVRGSVHAWPAKDACMRVR